VGWIGEWAWAPPVAITGVFLVLLYPRGHLLGPRWRWVAYLCGVAVAACVLVGAFKPGPMRDAGFPHHRNPFGVQSLEPLFNVLQYAVLVIPLATIAAVVSLVIRFRRADSVERLQIKWLAAAAGLSGLLYAVVLLLAAVLVPRGHPEPGWLTNLQGFWFASLALIPVSVAVAVMRYRLFEIDVIIRLTLIYAALVAGLAVIYLGGVA
jgi:two-component system, NarL family, sensor kinase